ncbi:MAG: hypothetical protein R2878_03095 [Thermoleophilia bacterium]
MPEPNRVRELAIPGTVCIEFGNSNPTVLTRDVHRQYHAVAVHCEPGESDVLEDGGLSVPLIRAVT